MGFLAFYLCTSSAARGHGGDLVKGAALRLHPNMRVAGAHGARNVPCNAHNHLVARTRLREFRYQRVTVIVPPPNDLRFVAHLRPHRPQRRDGAGRTIRLALACGEDVPLRLTLADRQIHWEGGARVRTLTQVVP